MESDTVGAADTREKAPFSDTREKDPFEEVSSPSPSPSLPHHTLSIFDSSKVADYMDCPRRFMFRHVFGWTTDQFHLKFGECFHLAIEHCLINDFAGDSIDQAMGIFLSRWPLEYEVDHPKNALTAKSALTAYAQHYKKDGLKILYTEIGGPVPIAPNRFLAFKLDAVVQDRDGYLWVLEHKTGSRHTQVWESQWQNRYQLHAYNHALRMAFDPKTVRGIIVNGIFFYKSNRQEFHRVRVLHSDEMQLLWLDEVNCWIDQIEADLKALSSADPADPLLRCFSRNPGCCTNYNSVCPYYPLCSTRANPLPYRDSNPLGLTVEYWDPLAIPVKESIESIKEKRTVK